jgi:hypothetical protein
MKTQVFLLSVLFLIAIGCSKENNVTTSEKDVITLEKSQTVTKHLSFKKSWGTYLVTYGENGCYPEYAQSVIEGEGNATHLGHFTVRNEYCVDFEGTPTTPIYGWLTHANGKDVIYTMVEDPANDIYTGPDGLLYFEYEIIGGEGRFEGAEGDILMYGTLTPETPFSGTWYLEGEGTITY